MRHRRWPVVALAALVAGSHAAFAGRSEGSAALKAGVAVERDGSFASRRPWFSTRLHVLVGADEALVYYAGAFGPGCQDETKGGWCRTCDLGPVVARRDSSGGFEIAGPEGKARLSAKDSGWQVRLVEGTAAWCGEGWSGDEFKTTGDHPKSCTVTRGAPAVALDVLPTEEGRLLVKSQGSVGVLSRKDVTCQDH